MLARSRNTYPAAAAAAAAAGAAAACELKQGLFELQSHTAVSHSNSVHFGPPPHMTASAGCVAFKDVVPRGELCCGFSSPLPVVA
jgi:hypothetical protein